MYQRLKCLRHKPVHDEEVFLDLELRIQPFEVSGVIIFYAMTQYEVLGTRRRTDRIGLDKTHPIEGAFQCSRLEKTTGDGIPPQMIQRDRHSELLHEGCMALQPTLSRGATCSLAPLIRSCRF